jgi:hypothetical protein
MDKPRARGTVDIKEVADSIMILGLLIKAKGLKSDHLTSCLMNLKQF